MSQSDETFKGFFLEHYLEHGLGSLSKSDIDALVMYLLDAHGWKDVNAFSELSNQQVSVKLKTPISRVKRLRYEAFLKFGCAEDVEKRSRALVRQALKKSAWTKDEKQLAFSLESTLARNWLQGELKLRGVVYDSSFNDEIVRLDVEDFIQVIAALLGDQEVADMRRQISREKFAAVKGKIKDVAVDMACDIAKGIIQMGLAKLGLAVSA